MEETSVNNSLQTLVSSFFLPFVAQFSFVSNWLSLFLICKINFAGVNKIKYS